MSPGIHYPHQKMFSFLYSFDFTSSPQFYTVDHHPFLVWIPDPLRPSQLSALFRILISSPKIHQCVFLNSITYILVNIQIYACYLNEKKPQICTLISAQYLWVFRYSTYVFWVNERMNKWALYWCPVLQSLLPLITFTTWICLAIYKRL